MRVVKGRSRLVVLLPALQVALKFPRMSISVAFRNVSRAAKSRKWKKFRKVWTRNVKTNLGVLGPLFFGAVANWNEFRFYTGTKHVLLQPTYFSLFGLVNVQRLAKPCTLNKDWIWEHLFVIVGDQLWGDHHHFGNPDNFTDDFRMVDYSLEITQEIIVKYGEKIATELLSASCCAEKGVEI